MTCNDIQAVGINCLASKHKVAVRPTEIEPTTNSYVSEVSTNSPTTFHLSDKAYLSE